MRARARASDLSIKKFQPIGLDEEGMLLYFWNCQTITGLIFQDLEAFERQKKKRFILSNSDSKSFLYVVRLTLSSRDLALSDRLSGMLMRECE